MGKGANAHTQTGVVRGGRVMKWKGQVASVAPSLFLASVSVAALSVGIAAAEVISAPQNTRAIFAIDEDNTITSTGAVNLTTGGGPSVEIATDYTSVFTNDGTITGPAATSTLGFGILLDGTLSSTGQIVNNGTINIDANGATNATAAGLVFLDDFAGAFVNTGTVTATATATSGGDPTAVGAVFFNGSVSKSYAWPVDCAGETRPG